MPLTRILTALSAIALAALAGLAPAAAQGNGAAAAAGSEVAYVESVNGRVLAMIAGRPTLLDTLDMIDERTRVDLLANSDLRICHYRRQRIVEVRGPLRISVTSSGVTVDGGKEVEASSEPCVKPAVSNFQGGFLARTTGVTSTKVALRPTIKIVNKAASGIQEANLWDSAQRNVIASFERNSARPTLNEGESYLLVVRRNDGSELKMMLQASPLVEARTLILHVH